MLIHLNLKFKTLCRYLVNNNYVEQTGLIIAVKQYHTDTGTLSIFPIKSNGEQGKAEIQFPASHIPEIIAALQTAYEATQP